MQGLCVLNTEMTEERITKIGRCKLNLLAFKAQNLSGRNKKMFPFALNSTNDVTSCFQKLRTSWRYNKFRRMVAIEQHM